VGFAVIKYKEGYAFLPSVGVIPNPSQNWAPLSKAFIFPLTLCFTFAWALEMVTHLEELCFWLFLVNANSGRQDWFASFYFKIWITGSITAVLYMPLVTIFTRSDPLKNEACTFLAGSLGSLCLTIWFMPILWSFPTFLDNLRSEGVDTATIVRLTKFHELNTIRVLFRYLFTIPLLVLGVDGVRPHEHTINENPFWTDCLTFIAAMGCVISSGITLIIFFPRSVEGEIAARDASRDRKRLRSQGSVMAIPGIDDETASMSELQSQDLMKASEYSQFDSHEIALLPERSMPGDGYPLGRLPTLPAIRPNRKLGDDIELGGIGTPGRFTEANLSRQSVRSSLMNPFVNHMIHSYTSPINMVYAGSNRSETSRLTFTRK